jgi:basic membrane protein A and related proteins
VKEGRPLRLAVLGASLLALLTLFLPARNEEPAGRGPLARFRIGLVLDIGGRGDKSFNDAAFVGISRASRELGVTTEILEPSGAEDREAAMRLFSSRGFDLVIGVGFVFSTDINVVARAFPKTRFACVDYAPTTGVPIPPNVSGLVFREEEGSFLVGAVAGLMSRTGHVGFVGGMDMALIHKFDAGYRAGVKEVCPTCTVHVAYAGSTFDAFHDPAKGKALAVSEITAGSDLIYHASGTTGHGVFEACKDMGKLGIGVDSDQYDEMPGVVVTSMIKRHDVAVFDTIAAVTRGEFTPGLSSFGLKEDGVGYVSEGLHGAGVPEAVKARVAELRARVVRGEIVVPSK